MEKMISCEFNMDTACVELRYTDGMMISIDCTEVEFKVTHTVKQRAFLDYLIYNAPPDMAGEAGILTVPNGLVRELSRRARAAIRGRDIRVTVAGHGLFHQLEIFQAKLLLPFGRLPAIRHSDIILCARNLHYAGELTEKTGAEGVSRTGITRYGTAVPFSLDTKGQRPDTQLYLLMRSVHTVAKKNAREPSLILDKTKTEGRQKT